MPLWLIEFTIAKIFKHIQVPIVLIESQLSLPDVFSMQVKAAMVLCRI